MVVKFFLGDPIVQSMLLVGLKLINNKLTMAVIIAGQSPGNTKTISNICICAIHRSTGLYLTYITFNSDYYLHIKGIER